MIHDPHATWNKIQNKNINYFDGEKAPKATLNKIKKIYKFAFHVDQIN